MICGRGGPDFAVGRADERADIDDPCRSAHLRDGHLFGRHVAGAARAVFGFVFGQPLLDFGRVGAVVEAGPRQGVGGWDEVRARVAVEDVPLLLVRVDGVFAVGVAGPADPFAGPPEGRVFGQLDGEVDGMPLTGRFDQAARQGLSHDGKSASGTADAPHDLWARACSKRPR